MSIHPPATMLGRCSVPPARASPRKPAACPPDIAPCSSRDSRYNARVRWLFVLLMIVATATASACRSDRAALPTADLTAERFSTRGRVMAVRATELEIYHERIESMRSALGKLEPMDPMTMVFAATTNASIEGIAVGDLVRVEFTTNYKTRPPLHLVAIEKLPADTPLELP
jgi:Cu/Ag efflux protein CusF